jgi:hypothetical protein
VDYKWITKVLTKRLIVVADSVMSMTQTAFIPRRNILERVVILYETMHELKRKKRKGVILKFDFEKAYDSFLALPTGGFREETISWEMD